MRKAVLVSLATGLLSVSAWGQVPDKLVYAWSRVPGGAESLGISAAYSPNSSHVLIGLAEQRRTWAAAIEYTHILHLGEHYRIDYEGSVLPLYLESDPTFVGTTTNINGRTFITVETPVRVVHVNHNPIGVAVEGNGITSPIYANYGRQSTYGAALAPIGARFSGFPLSGIQPSFAIDLGFVVATRDLPVDESDQFNYLFSFGPGVRIYSNPHASVRIEYIFRHISNAHQGYQNPGVDQGVFRVTLSHHR